MYIYILYYIILYILYTYPDTYKRTSLTDCFFYNEEASCKSYTSCAQVAILLLQDLSTLCVTDIYGIHFRLSAQCP